jgi:Excalibur calcium-binding domain
MGDPSGPWQEYGGGSPRGPGAPPPAPRLTPPPPLRRPPFLEPPPSVPPGPGLHGYPDAGDEDGLTGEGYGEDGYIGDGYGEDGYGDAGDEREASGIAADYGYGRPGDHVATATGLAGVVASVRAAAADAAWRYRSAPLWARITADVVAGALVLALVVGVSLMLRGDDEPQQAASREPISIETVPTTSTTVATTTTVPTTTTTVPPTTTTVPPTTVTTSPPIVPPPTEPPSPPTTDEVRYRDCFEAWLAGALPLRRGDPGYGPHLDRDGDGEACEFRDDGGGGGGGG